MADCMGFLKTDTPDTFWEKRTKCALCRSLALDEIMGLAPTPPANEFVENPMIAQDTIPLTLLLCGACGHVQLREIVSPNRLFGSYVYVSGTSPSFVQHFKDYARICSERFKPEKHDLIVDIGSNDGTLLHAWKHLGAENTLGIEPANKIAEAARSSGVDTICDFFTPELARKIRGERGPAKIVTANNVFAHVEDLRAFGEAVKILLDSQSVFTFEVSYLGNVIEDLLFDTIYHEHSSYHALAPLVSFFTKELGLHVFDVEKISTHGGSLRVYVSPTGASPTGASPENHPPYLSVACVLAEERKLGLDKKETYRNFKERISQKGLALRSHIKEIKEKGHRIAGYGAPAKLTTLMYEMGISPFDIEYIVDDSPWKQGLYTPGHHIPVLPVSALYDSETDVDFKTSNLLYEKFKTNKVKRCDYAIIFAWNFADVIVKTHREYIKQGGTFISPFSHIPYKLSPFDATPDPEDPEK
jgi:hypothetical protein